MPHTAHLARTGPGHDTGDKAADQSKSPTATGVHDRNDLARVRDQATRYFRAVYGDNWIYRAPEQWTNLVERWIWAVSSGDFDFAETVMANLEAMAARPQPTEINDQG